MDTSFSVPPPGYPVATRARRGVSAQARAAIERRDRLVAAADLPACG